MTLGLTSKYAAIIAVVTCKPARHQWRHLYALEHFYFGKDAEIEQSR